MTYQKINKQICKLLKSLLVVFAYSVIWLFGYSSKVLAQEISLSITPPLTEVTIQPGKSFNQAFTVTNNGAPVVLAAKIFPFIPADAQGHAEIVEDKNSVDTFSPWFSFDQTPISLETAGSHSFNVTISPPGGIEEKDYYFTFIAEVQNDDNNLGVTSSQAQARIGANILMTVSKDGNPVKKATIINFSAPVVIDSFSTLTYKVLLGNPGGSFFKPTGKITIDQIFGSTTVLNLAPLNILAGGTREVSCIQGESLIPCKLPGKFLIGIYRANVSFTTDNSGGSVEKQVYTLALPFSVILGLITIFALYYIIRKLTH